jgi:hypothetical protein
VTLLVLQLMSLAIWSSPVFSYIIRLLLARVHADDYLNMWCNQSLLDCVAAARPTAMADTFEGNRCNVTDVADEITAIVEAAVYARGILHKP